MESKSQVTMTRGKATSRVWLMTGAALLAWQINQQSVQADTGNAAQTSNDKTLTVTQPDTTTAGTTVLRTGQTASPTSEKMNNSAENVTNETEQSGQSTPPATTSTTDDGTGADAAADQVNADTVSEQPATSADAKSANTPEVSATNGATTTSEVPVSATDNPSATNVTPTAAEEEPVTNNTEPEVTESEPTEVEPTTPAEPESTTSGTSSEPVIAVSGEDATVTPNGLKGVQLAHGSVRPLMAKAALVAAEPVAVTDYDGYNAAAEDRRGIWGTSEWWLDENNVLNIGGGQLTDTNVKMDQDGKVTDWGNIGWQKWLTKDPTKDENLLIQDVKIWDTVRVGSDATHLFSGLRLTGDPEFNDENLDTKGTTNMAYMFSEIAGNHSLPTSMTVSFDTGNVTNMQGMFSNINGRRIIINIDFDTSNVTNMSHMFYNVENLHKLYWTKKFKTSAVTDLSYFFANCAFVVEMSPVDFDTSNVTNMSYMFFHTTLPDDLSLSSFKTDNVTDMSHMFDSFSYLSHNAVDISNFDTSKVTTMAGMFKAYDGFYSGLLDNLNTTSVQDMSEMFANQNFLEQLTLPTSFDTSGVLDMHGMFRNVNQMTSLDISQLDTSKVTDMSFMFAGMIALTEINLSPLKTDKVTNMAGMFMNDWALTNLNVSDFNTSQVVNMSQMFLNMTSLTSLNVSSSSFDTSQVVDMSTMFAGMPGLRELDVSSLITTNVKNMMGMFMGDAGIGSLDLTNFHTPNLTDANAMFFLMPNLTDLNLTHFNQKNSRINYWDGLGVPLKLNGMFSLDKALGNYLVDVGTLTPEILDVPVNLRVLTLSKDSRLTLPGTIKTLEDIYYVSEDDDMTLDKLLASMGLTDVSELSVLLKAGLNDAEGPTGRWMNTRTGEALTAAELTARYSDAQADLATTDTWTWQAEIIGHDITKIADATTSWKLADSVVSARDNAGTPLNMDQLGITITDLITGKVVAVGDVHPDQTGRYQITVTYTDPTNVVQAIEKFSLQFVANQAAIDADNSVITVGETWLGDNLKAATDADGSTVALERINVSGSVDGQTPGVYQVTYQFNDQFKNLVTKTVQVIVKGLTLTEDTKTVSTDDHWDPRTNVALVFDALGNQLAGTDVDVQLINAAGETVVKLNRPGVYQVVYSIPDGTGTLSQTATVTVLAGENLAKLQLKDSAIFLYQWDQWDALANVESATDSDGTVLDPTTIQITNPVDFQQVGTYDVNYTFVDLFGERQTATATVTILANQAGLALTTSQQTFYAGDQWDAKSFVTATAIDGTDATAQVKITDTVDRLTPGTYTVLYGYTDKQETLHSAKLIVTVLANLAGLDVKEPTVQLRAGDKWSAIENIKQALDVDGTDLTDKVHVTGKVDLAHVGKNTVTYELTDRQGNIHRATTVVEVLENLAVLDVKEPTVQLRAGDKWSVIDNIKHALDVDGTDLTDQVNITGNIDLTTIGTNTVSYELTDRQGKIHRATTIVEVLENLADLRVKATEVELRVGDKWNATENIAHALEVDGVDITNKVHVIGTVDLTKVGTTNVTYELTDRQGTKHTATTNINILENLAKLDVKEPMIELRVGDKWSALNNIAQALDVDGTDLTDQVNITGTVDLTKVGANTVTYELTDRQGNKYAVTTNVKVLENLVSLRVKAANVQLRAGDEWDALDNVIQARDVDGTNVIDQIKISNNVDLTIPGEGTVSYEFVDQQGFQHTATTTITVLENLANLNVKQETINLRVGDVWDARTNLQRAADVDGTDVTDRVVISSTVDTSKTGSGTVTYGFVDQHGIEHLITTAVTVLENLADLSVQDSNVELRVGDQWNAIDNIQRATDVDGTDATNQLTINSTIDLTTAGVGTVTYEFTDQQGVKHLATTEVRVLENLANLSLKQSVVELRVGDQWDANDNVARATDVDGTKVTVSVNGTVDATVAGDYRLTYSFVDQQQKRWTATADVRVLPNEAQLQLNQTAVQLSVGDAWDALANVLVARDVDGSTVPLDRVQVSDPVNTATAGQYQVTYWFTDQQQRRQSATATVTVSAPEVPVDPDKPVEPEVPVDPEKPVKPEVPVDPEKPVEPEVPVDPEKPVEPEVPVDPEKPVEPEVPTDPDKPIEPEVPANPDKPVVPETPTAPERPVEPATPTTSTEPGVPVTTVKPDQLSGTPKAASPVTTEAVSTPVRLAPAQSALRRESNAPAKTSRVTRQATLPQTDEDAPTSKVGAVLLSLIALLTFWFPRRKR
ncbi:DUF5011 domain-containing protein [Lactiplantibacillus garii]|uniref:DUF5011 domain-containing protein n=1 Tax=Lactiplantibacillus garii TaxID=2306423 RepID=A0A426D6Z9_9LACO|nr:immunoglobulin-like domain-containing protein [Lactiplantibacillus garii]RRK10229.1 DUF5011 domain-containing protein [Lactiplantibacillus garii]